MLTSVAVRTAKPKEKTTRLYDEKGLYLEVSPKGGKWWRLKYRFDGRERRMSLGVYPEVSLKDARERRDNARQKVANHIDPQKERKAAAHATTGTFKQIAYEWHDTFKDTWVDAHRKRIMLRLENDIFPWLGERPISSIEAPDILECLRRVEARGAVETAHRILSSCSQIFRYGIATSRVKRDPCGDLRGALPPSRPTHLPAILDPEDVGTLLRDIHGYEGRFPTRCALQIAPMVFVRPVELRTARWEEIDWEKNLWVIPKHKMKMREDHIVPLASQVITILKELHPLTGAGEYLFPSIRGKDRPMSNNSVNSALRRLGYDKHTISGHGFRATARTLLDEELGYRPDYIEQQLAHRVRDPLGRAYNRTKHLDQRREMMQRWADYLEELRDGSQSS